MNKIFFAGALAAAITQPAQAGATVKTPAPTIIYAKSVYSIPTWTTAKVFQDFQTGTANSAGLYKAGAGETVSGGVYLDKDGSNKYLEVDPGGSYKVSFSQAVQYLSFNLGSWASTDTVKLTFQNGTVLSLVGGAIYGANGSSMLGTGGNVIFDMTGQSGISSILFGNGEECGPFFLDNLASAAPEPAAWGMMILGFGLAGATLRRRRVRIAFA